MIHNQEVHHVDTPAVQSDELWSFVKKSKSKSIVRSAIGRMIEATVFFKRKMLQILAEA